MAQRLKPREEALIRDLEKDLARGRKSINDPLRSAKEIELRYLRRELTAQQRQELMDCIKGSPG